MTLRPSDMLSRSMGIVIGIICIAGAIALLSLSHDVMRVLIHWIGEERALGPQNVIHNADGSMLLTNPVAMAKYVLLIWGVGLCQMIAGGYLAWRSIRRDS